MRRIAWRAGQLWPKCILNSTRTKAAAAVLALGGGMAADAVLAQQPQPRNAAIDAGRGPSLADRRATPLRGGVGGAGANQQDAAETGQTPADNSTAAASKTSVDAAGLKGITPGASTVEQLRTAWGEPKQTRSGEGIVEPGRQVFSSDFHGACPGSPSS